MNWNTWFRHGSAARGCLLTCLFLVSGCAQTVRRPLPPGGMTSWEIEEVEAIVTFLLFDPGDPAVALPTGLRFIGASKV